MNRTQAGTPRRRVVRTAVVGLLAGAAVALAGTPAAAATGTVLIRTPDGVNLVVRNPPPGCRSLFTQPTAGTMVGNFTDSAIVLYPRANCFGSPSLRVPPGGSTTFPLQSFYVES